MATNRQAFQQRCGAGATMPGRALFSYGFRPFFLGAAIWAALGILLWLPQYFGELTKHTYS